MIQLTPRQQMAVEFSLPCVVSGAAGTGKSCVALSLLIEMLNRTQEEGPLLYVSKSRELVNFMRQSWKDLPASQDAGRRVRFMTYNELFRSEQEGLSEEALVGEEAFISWYTRYATEQNKKAKATRKKLITKNASEVYQEFRIASGYDKEEYLKLGAKQSTFKEASEREWLYALYAQYQSVLKEAQQINPELYRFEPKTHYSLVVSDESQDLTHGQLAQLHQYAKGSVIFCMDTHQSLQGSLSVRPFLFDQLKIPERHHVELTVSHRCPMRVVGVANKIVTLKHRAIGGLSDKRESVGIERSASEHDLGHVFLIEPQHVLDNPWLKTQISKPYCAVITSEAHLEEARRYFSDSLLVLTPSQSKGLQYSIVIAWKLFPPAFMKQLIQDYKGLDASGKPVHRPKNGLGEAHLGPELNQIYTSYTRSEQILIISEENSRENQFLLNELAHFAEAEVPSESSLHRATLEEDWEQQAFRQLEVGNEGLALTIFQSKLRKTPEECCSILFHHRFAQPPVPEKKEAKEWKSLPQEPKEEPQKLSATKKPSVSSKKPGKRKKAAKKDKPPVQAKKIEMTPEILKAKPYILGLEKDFSARRLELVLKLCPPGVWFYSYENETSKAKVVLAELLLQEKHWRIFTSLMVNNPEILRAIPLDAIKKHLQKQLNPEQQKDLKELNKIARLSDLRPLLEIAVEENNIPWIRTLHRLGANLNAPNNIWRHSGFYCRRERASRCLART